MTNVRAKKGRTHMGIFSRGFTGRSRNNVPIFHRGSI